MVDVVVVGAGVVGLNCAYALRRRGLEVLVVDRGEVGAGASAGNAGWIVPCLSGPVPHPSVRRTACQWLLRPDSPLSIRPRADAAFLRWLWRFWRRCNGRDFHRGLAATARLNARTMPLFDALAADGVAFEMSRDGVLFLLRSEAAARAEYDELAAVARFGVPEPRWLDRADLRDEEPLASDEVVAGVLAPEERHVRPESLTAGLAARLRELGTTITTGVDVAGFTWAGNRVTGVRTGDGLLGAGHVVLAAGAYTGRLAARLGVRCPLEGGKGYSVTLTPPPVPLRRPTYLAEARVACTPFAGALRLAGTMELSGLNERLSPTRLRALTHAGRHYLRDWPAVDAAGWAGLRPMAPDGLPIIGRAPRFDNLYLATGHAMLGVTLGPATGEAIAELVSDTADATLLAPFSPARFA